MNNSVGLGGLTLLIAAVVWLLIFVPGYTKRSQIRETTNVVRAASRQAASNQPLTPDQRLRRLVNTQRTFSIVFLLGLIGSIASALAALTENSWWFGFALSLLVSVAGLFIQRAAANQAASIASKLHRDRQQVRRSASKTRASAQQNRDWSPNPIPAPLAPKTTGELVQPLAEVIKIEKPRPTLASKEIDEILARRRAI